MSKFARLKRMFNFNFDAGGLNGLASFRPSPPSASKRAVLDASRLNYSASNPNSPVANEVVMAAPFYFGRITKHKPNSFTHLVVSERVMPSRRYSHLKVGTRRKQVRKG